MAPNDPEDRPTGVTCFACGGDFEKHYETAAQYRVETCRWCTAGIMNAAQIQKWRAKTQRGQDGPSR